MRKLNASPKGKAIMTIIVVAHLSRVGANGVPNGRVEAQKCGHGSTP